jgi:glutamine synthetase
MKSQSGRQTAKSQAIHRTFRQVPLPMDSSGKPTRISQYYGENVFDFKVAQGIPDHIKSEMIEVSRSRKLINRENAEVVAKAVTDWATTKGVTHFCHWFQPLTGSTAEKHDSFLDLKNSQPVERLSVSQLLQGEPDASSFPHGGSRSTFEARGYTTWDLTSPMFIVEGPNGKTLCIPTAFVSYTGDALDIKTPLLRSVSAINKAGKRLLKVIDEVDTDGNVFVTTGCEQEYFLVDKSFYYSRPDLVMTGRTLFGSLSSRNQQLSDHYFGLVPERVLGFMQELDLELHRLGIPSKTRHNEVAPGQFEIAPIFTDANVSADNNQLLMGTLKRVAEKHNFVALMHEKPFAGVNGSGKHVNWSIATDEGDNLFNPGRKPEENIRFLAMVSMVLEAVNRHQGMLRMAIASSGNDHRLGANEAPPSIISIYLGDTLDRVLKSIKENKSFTPDGNNILDLGTDQLADLLKDNTDRNRTSPFAFTGNKFEFRAVGSTASVGFPVSILNAAMAEVMEESADFIEEELKNGSDKNKAMSLLISKWCESSYDEIVFNGDGYSDEWVQMAEKRGLKNMRTTADSLSCLVDENQNQFLLETGVYRKGELDTRYNVLLERYNMLREIEFNTLLSMVNQTVIPAALTYKEQLGTIIKMQKEIGLESSVEIELYKKLNFSLESLFSSASNLDNEMKNTNKEDLELALQIANDFLPMSETIANHCNEIESLVPESNWDIPTYFDMLFLR